MKLLAVALAGGLARRLEVAMRPMCRASRPRPSSRSWCASSSRASRRATSERSTLVTEGEVNSYLTFRAGDQLPGGRHRAVDRHPVAGALERARRCRSRRDPKEGSSGGWLDPTSYLTGTLPVTASGVLRTADGAGAVPARDRCGERYAHPESLPAGHRRVLHAHRHPIRTASGSTIRSSCPRRSAASTPTTERPSSFSDPQKTPRTLRAILARLPLKWPTRSATPAAVPQGRWPAQSSGPEEGGTPHRRRSALSLSHPLRRSQPAAADRSASSRARPSR